MDFTSIYELLTFGSTLEVEKMIYLLLFFRFIIYPVIRWLINKIKEVMK